MNQNANKKIRHIPWWSGIRGRLLILFMTLLGLGLIALNIYIFHISKLNLFEMGRERNLNEVQKINVNVESFMQAIVRDLFSMSRIWPAEHSSIMDRRLDLERILERNEHIRALSISDIQGNMLLRVTKRDTLPEDLLKDQSEVILESILEGRIYISQVYPATQTFPVVDISIPLRSEDQDQVRGVLTAIISLKEIYKRLEMVELKRGQELYLVDTNGLVIAYFSYMGGQNVLGIKGLVPFWGNMAHIKKVQQYLSGIHEKSLSNPLIYRNLREQDVLGVLSICPELRWGIILEESLNVLLEPTSDMIKKNILITILILIVFSFLAILLLGFVLSPLIHLYQYTEHLGEDSETINMKGKDEIGRIGQNVNQLVKALCQKRDHLHRRYKAFESIRKEFDESYDQLEHLTKELEVSQADLKREKVLKERLIETADFFIVGLGLEGHVLIFNKSCEKRLGYQQDEILGKNWFEMVYPQGDRTAAMTHFQRSLQGEAPEVKEDKILTKKGDYLNIEWHTTIIHDSKNQVAGVILIGEDVSQKRKMEEELKLKNLLLSKNNEDLENVLSIVSHDLKNPLYILQDFASILLQEYKGTLSEDALYYLQRIKANAKHMERLILDLLELTRVSRSKGIWQECAISEIVERALSEFKEVIKERGIRVQIPDIFPICLCDSERMLRVFSNLLSNAIKFSRSRENPIVEIGYHETEHAYEFFVRDNGIGIEKEYHEKIFVIFQRLQEVRDVEGTGMGLTIVKKIVEDHGGRIWVESKKDEGATFYFTISKRISEIVPKDPLRQS